MFHPLLSLVTTVLLVGSAYSTDEPSLKGAHVDAERGFEMREYTLKQPFHSLYGQWDLKGDTVVINNKISLTRNAKSMAGAIWSKHKTTERDWEAQVSVRLYGGGGTWHAEGMALWHISEPTEGRVFGASDVFRGVGVFLDTYKNDDNSYESFPRISIVLSDGTKTLDWDKDGKNVRIGGCSVHNVHNNDNDSRSNKAFKLLVKYHNENLEVYYAPYEDDTFTHCETVKDVRIPLNYIFGVSASTGDLTNNHEVISFKVSALDAAPHSRLPAIKPEYLGATEATPIEENTNGMGWVTKLLIFILLIVVCIGGFIFYKSYWEPNVHRRKRFY